MTPHCMSVCPSSVRSAEYDFLHIHRYLSPVCSQVMTRGKTGWWRKYYLDHPLKSQKHPSSFASPDSDKFKVLCRGCLNKALAEAKRANPDVDERDVTDRREFPMHFNFPRND